MAQVLLDQVIDTDYGQFDLLWGDGYGFDGDFDKFFAGQVNGLAGVGSGEGLYAHFGRRAGGSHVRVMLLDSSPTEAAEQWEDVVEVSVVVPKGVTPAWTTWAGDEASPLALPPNTYRVRVYAQGRDAGRDGEDAEEVLDFYLIEFWPAPAEQDAILRTRSDDAAYWHREVGSNR